MHFKQQSSKEKKIQIVNTGTPAAALTLQLPLWVTHYLSVFETAYLHLTHHD